MTAMSDDVLKCRLQSMLELQDGINCRIRPDWRTANNAWYRAIWTECAELLDHIGWKWWKQQTPDLPQVHLELVDIFHFGLSELLQQHESVQDAAEHYFSKYADYGRTPAAPASVDACLERIESFALAVLTTKRFDLAAFCHLAIAVGLNEVDIYELYVGKNVLNAFRQDHGYKTGEYLKMWHGREDNVWLTELSASMEKNPNTFSVELYDRLAQKYAEVTRGG